MTEKKGRGTKRSDRPPVDLAAELKLKRDSFVHTFFKKGAEFTEELLRENERLRRNFHELERENAQLRSQLASDKAIRDLLQKIDDLEREKRELLSHMHEAEAISTRFINRYAQIEEELANLANLHVASWHLHSTLKLHHVVRHLKELLAQLVGARVFVLYLADPFDLIGSGEAETRARLVPVASEGMGPGKLRTLKIGAIDDDDSDGAVIERVFLTNVPHIVDGPLAQPPRTGPAACIPMRVDNRAVGVIVLKEVLAQKERFVAVDFELFKMLGVHAAAALVAAQLFSAAERKLPDLGAFETLEAHTAAPAR
jgi:hypothetical protein